jgi:hypothetical protein
MWTSRSTASRQILEVACQARDGRLHILDRCRDAPRAELHGGAAQSPHCRSRNAHIRLSSGRAATIKGIAADQTGVAIDAEHGT